MSDDPQPAEPPISVEKYDTAVDLASRVLIRWTGTRSLEVSRSEHWDGAVAVVNAFLKAGWRPSPEKDAALKTLLYVRDRLELQEDYVSLDLVEFINDHLGTQP